MRGERIPVDVALYVATEVAHALAHAHEATADRGERLGIVHRDVKPSNVLLSRAGEVKLGDFGIAIARERAWRTTGDVARGTPSYMAPEQLFGGVIDARTDVFALGCCLHALLTGQSPMADPTTRVALLAGEQWLRPILEPDVAAIVARATRLAPDERPASAREMAGELGSALARRLRTDVKTRMAEWLGSLHMDPRLSDHRPAPTTSVIASTGDRTFTSRDPVAPPPATTVTSNTGDRTFTSHGPAPPQPPPTTSIALDHGFASHSSPGALPPARRDALAPPSTTSKSRFRVMPLFWGLGAVLVLGITAALGAIAAPRLVRAVAARDAGPAHSPAPPASVPIDAPSPEQDARPPDDAAAAQTETETETAGTTGGARSAPALPPPVERGCRCDAQTAPAGSTHSLWEGLCHPAQVRNPSCFCNPDQGRLCWVPFEPTRELDKACPERLRTLPASSRDGEACTGYLVETKDRDGAPASWADTKAQGRLVCNRCETRLVYPRTPGAPCIGVSNRTGARVEGRIDCSYTSP